MSKKKARPTKKKVVKTTNSTPPKVVPTVSRTVAASETVTSATPAVNHTPLIFNRQNYTLLGISAALIIGGMLLMLGGSQPDPDTWNPDIIYSTRITLLGPLVILSGLILAIVAIFRR